LGFSLAARLPQFQKRLDHSRVPPAVPIPSGRGSLGLHFRDHQHDGRVREGCQGHCQFAVLHPKRNWGGQPEIVSQPPVGAIHATKTPVGPSRSEKGDFRLEFRNPLVSAIARHSLADARRRALWKARTHEWSNSDHLPGCRSALISPVNGYERHGIRISDKTVAKLLREHGYSLRAPSKVGGRRTFAGSVR